MALSPARALARTLLVAALLTVAVVGLVRVMLPSVGHYREEVAAWIGESLGKQVAIGSLEAGWRGWTPELWVSDVRVLGPGDAAGETRTLARFEHASITLDPLETLTQGALVPRELTVRGASLAVSRDASGQLRVSGMPSRDGPAGDGQELAGWLLDQGRLRLDSTHIVLTLGNGRPVTLRDVSMDVRRVDDGHHLDLTLRLPGRRAGAVSLNARLAGDVRDPNTWTGTIDTVADDVDLRAVPGIEDLLGIEVGAGRARVRLASTWSEGRPDRFDAQLELSDASIGRGRPLGIPVASAQARGERVGERWEVALEDLTMTTTSGVWPRTQAALVVRPASGDTPLTIEASVGFVRVQDALSLLGPPLGERSERALALLESEPRGEIHGLELSIEHDGEGPRILRADGQFIELATGAPIGALLAIDGLSGTVSADPAKGTVTVWRGGLEGDFGGALEAPTRFERLAGTVSWDRADGAMRIETEDLTVSNDEIEASVAGEARFGPEARLPTVDAKLTVARADIAALNHYIPHASIPRGLSRWLRGALVAGTLSEGEVLLDADLERFSLDDDNVVVKARALVEDGELAYAKRWAPVEEVQGSVELDGRRMHMEIDEGRIFDSAVSRTTIDIDDVRLKPVIVEVKGLVTGNTQDAARYLRESPLGPKFKHFLDTVSATGPSTLELDMTIPARREARKEVHGLLAVRDNLVGLPAMSEGLQSVNGVFAFTGKEVSADGVEALYLDRPIALSAGKLEGSRATRLTVEGRADAAYLAAHLHNAGLLNDPDPDAWVLTSRLTGETNWTAIIDVPHVVAPGATRARIRVESTLAGVSSKLPRPFDKAPDAPGGIGVETSFEANGDRLMRLEYGSVARSRLWLKPGLGRHRLHSGALRLGGSSVELPEGEGIVIDGHIEELSLADWLALMPGAVTGERSRGSLISAVRSADLNVRELEVAGLNFEHALMTGTKSEREGWRFEVEGPHASGVVLVPNEFGAQGIEATFRRMVFRPDEEAERAAAPGAADPRKLPPMRFTCLDCMYKDLPIGTIEASTSPTDSGLRIESLDIVMPHAKVTATGTWSAEGPVQQTHLDARGKASDLGAMLGVYTTDEPPASGGSMDVLLNAAWPGSPGAFELSRVEGVLQMRARDGRLMNLDPGAGGRFFQLISVTSLPRRLRLDFSDLQEEGLGYDAAEGTFTITDGNAFTEDLYIDSEVARVDIRGRTGLEAEDYDQVVTITPKVTKSLPLAPIWLAEKMLNAQIFDKVFASRFTVTGTWDDPIVEKVIVPGVQVEGEK